MRQLLWDFAAMIYLLLSIGLFLWILSIGICLSDYYNLFYLERGLVLAIILFLIVFIIMLGYFK
jgi:hypothetical protein